MSTMKLLGNTKQRLIQAQSSVALRGPVVVDMAVYDRLLTAAHA